MELIGPLAVLIIGVLWLRRKLLGSDSGRRVYPATPSDLGPVTLGPAQFDRLRSELMKRGFTGMEPSADYPGLAFSFSGQPVVSVLNVGAGHYFVVVDDSTPDTVKMVAAEAFRLASDTK